MLGNSLGDGLWSGLYRAFEEDTNLEIVNNSKPPADLRASTATIGRSAVDDILKDETYQIAVVMFGANDDQPIRSGKDSLKLGTDAWRDVYGQRVEAFIKKLRAKNMAVYWVGLPVMRSPEQSEDAEALNEVYREKSFINGAKFIDTWSGFTDESGRYSAYGPDMSGQVRRLRADDGVHLHPARLPQTRPFGGEGNPPRPQPCQARAQYSARRQRGRAGQGHGARREPGQPAFALGQDHRDGAAAAKRVKRRRLTPSRSRSLRDL